MSYCAAEDLNERQNSECDTDQRIQLCVLTSERSIQTPYLHNIV